MGMSVGSDTADAGRCADEVRFGQLYERCLRPIRDFCSRRVPADAIDDAVADTFLTLWRRLDEVPGGDAALLWMYGVAYRVIAHQRRSLARRSRLQERLRTVGFRPAAAADDAVVNGVESRRVLGALARLGDTDAEVLRLVAWEQLSVTSVAAVLGIEPDTARQRLHRARRNLARQYDRLQSRPTSTTPAAPTGGAR
jgi:RNA polymerase sigma-70 factor (ECF subfamily)